MTKAQIQGHVLQLAVEEQLELAQEIWDAVAPDLDLEPPPELATLIEERRAAAHADPRAGRSVDAVHARLRRELARGRA